MAVSTNVDISDDESGIAKGILFKPWVEATRQMTQNWTLSGTIRETIHDAVAEFKGVTADFSTSKLRMAEDMAECL